MALRFLVLLIFTSILFSSCGTDTEKPDSFESNYPENYEETAEDSLDKLEFIVENVPSPLKIIGVIRQSTVPFTESLLNPGVNAALYLTSARKALNLGIYGTDIGYVIIYDQAQLVLKYFKSVSELSGQIGIPHVFTNQSFRRYETNKNNRDSLDVIASEGYIKIDKFLRDNQNFDLATMVLIGGWVESIYLTSHSIKIDPTDANKKLLFENIENNHKYLSKFIRFLERYGENAEYADLLKEIKMIEKDFQFIASQKNMTADKKDIQEKFLKNLTYKIGILREKIVGV